MYLLYYKIVNKLYTNKHKINFFGKNFVKTICAYSTKIHLKFRKNFFAFFEKGIAICPSILYNIKA